MALHVSEYGEGDVERPAVVLAHGFTQAGLAWAPVIAELGAEELVRSVDLPGHGASADIRADLEHSADLLVDAGGAGVYVGYSLGGRTALVAALRHPEAVRGLVLVSATAGIDDPAERAERRRADGELADRLENDGTAAFIDRWLALDLFADLAESQAQRSLRVANPAEGLAASLRLAGTGTMDPPCWDRLGEIGMPVRVVAGDTDAKFTALAERLAAGIGPAATLAVAPGVGHAVPALAPAWLAGQIRGAVDDAVGR